MPEIVPAILEETKENFLHKSEQVIKLPALKRVQVDFADGLFVPHTTLSVSEIDTLNPAFLWEAHLMLKNPGEFLDYDICGFKTIIIHYEAYQNADELKAALAGIKALNLKCGVAVNPETPVSVLAGLKNEADQFVILSVHPGFQGGEFLPEAIGRVKELRRLLPNAIIELDGGLNETNIKDAFTAGADLLVVGSALVKAADIAATWERLRKSLSSS